MRQDCATPRMPIVRPLLALLTLSVTVLCEDPTAPPPHLYDYLIVGAGPSGLQLGHFLERANRDYIILERGNVSGNFFTKYPRHDKLISINKRHTGKTNKEFNLRHDWNSLISDNEQLLYKHYSREIFPPRETILKYLADYERELGIQVQHNTEVSNIARQYNSSTDENYFTMNDQNGNLYNAKTVILATGISVPNLPKFNGSEFVEEYEHVSVDPEDFEGQSVLILGRGNAAFEVADRIYGSTNMIHMVGRSRVRLSWSTHYVGDLRAVNNGLLDTYQLKSLDGVLEAPVEELNIMKDGDRLKLELFALENEDDEFEGNIFDNFALRDSYDRVISCLGFRFDESILEGNVTRCKGRKKKFPKISHDYQSADMPGLYYAGTNTHSLDFRKSAGGFIHGFRYTARALFHLLEVQKHNVPWPSTTKPIAQLLPHIMKRINEASGTYQMFEVLGDVIALRNDNTEFEYFEEFPINLISEFPKHTGKPVDSVIVLLLQYGANFSGPGEDVFRFNRATGEPSEAFESNFLHPVFYYYKTLPTELAMKMKGKHDHLPRPDRVHHMVEDFLTTWDAPSSHILPLRRFIEYVTQEDSRQFYAEDCLQMALTHSSLPLTCRNYFMEGAGLVGNDNLLGLGLENLQSTVQF